MEYEVKFEDGVTERPANIVNGEQIMPNMRTLVFIKKRAVAAAAAGV